MPIFDPYKPKPFSKNGWFCKTCGAWVPDGVLHNCAASRSAAPVPPDALAKTINEILCKQGELEVRIKLLEDALRELTRGE